MPRKQQVTHSDIRSLFGMNYNRTVLVTPDGSRVIASAIFRKQITQPNPSLP
jgi:hypothetical protein